jgi:hypothetical protein
MRRGEKPVVISGGRAATCSSQRASAENHRVRSPPPTFRSLQMTLESTIEHGNWTVAPIVRFTEALQPAHQGGPRRGREAMKPYLRVIAQPPAGSLILVDDLITSGGLASPRSSPARARPSRHGPQKKGPARDAGRGCSSLSAHRGRETPAPTIS